MAELELSDARFGTFVDADLVAGTPETRRRAREERRREQALTAARRAGWDYVESERMERHGPYLVDTRTGRLYRVSRAMAHETDPSVSAYTVTGSGAVLVLASPPPYHPQTLDELKARQAQPSRRNGGRRRR